MDSGKVSLTQLKEQKEKAAAELQALWKQKAENQEKRTSLRKELVDLQRELRTLSANGATDLEVLQDLHTERESIVADKETLTEENNAYTFEMLDVFEGHSQELIAKSEDVLGLIHQFPNPASVYEEFEQLQGLTTELQNELDNLCASAELMAAALKSEEGASRVVDIDLGAAKALLGQFKI